MFAHDVPFPTIKKEDHLHKAVLDILGILQYKKKIIPTLQIGNKVNDAVQQIAQLLGRVKPKPALAITPPVVSLPRVPLPSSVSTPNISSVPISFPTKKDKESRITTMVMRTVKLLRVFMDSHKLPYLLTPNFINI